VTNISLNDKIGKNISGHFIKIKIG
jgi:hypothetical protein